MRSVYCQDIVKGGTMSTQLTNKIDTQTQKEVDDCIDSQIEASKILNIIFDDFDSKVQCEEYLIKSV